MAAPAPHAQELARIPVREREAVVLGSTTRYWDYGPEDADVDLVLVHGYRGDHHGLEPAVAELAGLRILSPDLPAFGESEPLVGMEHSIAGYARWLDAFLAATGTRGAPLLGHSFGTIVVAHAIAAGTPVSRLVLINPIAADPMHGALPTLTRLYYRIGEALPEGLGRAWLASRLIVRFMSVTLAKTPDRALRRWIHEEHDRYFSTFSDRRSLAEGFDASTSTNVTAVAAALTMPTLLIAGEQDMVAPIETVRSLAAQLSDARLIELAGVGHLIHYERPAEAAAAIRAFLGRPGETA